MYLQLAKGGTMSGMSIHYVYLMDENDNLVGNVNKWSGFTEKTVDIPAGSAYVRVGINSSHSATSKEQYAEGFKNGDIVPYVKFR